MINNEMTCVIKKHTGIEDARDAINSTMGAGFAAKATLRQVYAWMHSPIRTQVFSIQFERMYSFVSVHLVRHVTTVPFVQSMRDDRGGTKKEDRYTPVKHRMFLNAEAILNIANKRLCYQASPETRESILMMRETMKNIDSDLAYNMVPSCVWRGGICCEPKPCGNYKIRRFNGMEDEIEMGVS